MFDFLLNAPSFSMSCAQGLTSLSNTLRSCWRSRGQGRGQPWVSFLGPRRCWDYKLQRRTWLFVCGFWGSKCGPVFRQQAFTDRTTFPARSIPSARGYVYHSFPPHPPAPFTCFETLDNSSFPGAYFLSTGSI